jgi:nicotinamidase/pyrazinamidase
MILGSVDSHAFDAWEFANAPEKGPNGESPNFPPHCVKGTHGWLKVAGTTAPRTRFVPNVQVRDLDAFVAKNDPQMLLFEKEVYSLFANPNAPAVLDRLGAQRFIVFGVATDYCVRAAALGLVEHGEVWMVGDAIAAVDAAGGEKAINECREKGVKLVSMNEALEAL